MSPSADSHGTTNGANGTDASLDWSTFKNTINGKQASTEKTRHGINPATGKPNPEVPVSTPDDVEKAIAAAQKAFKPWAKTPYSERKKAVLAFADALVAEKDGFAKMLTQEQGKPVCDSR